MENKQKQTNVPTDESPFGFLPAALLAVAVPVAFCITEGYMPLDFVPDVVCMLTRAKDSIVRAHAVRGSPLYAGVGGAQPPVCVVRCVGRSCRERAREDARHENRSSDPTFSSTTRRKTRRRIGRNTNLNSTGAVVDGAAGARARRHRTSSSVARVSTFLRRDRTPRPSPREDE